MKIKVYALEKLVKDKFLKTKKTKKSGKWG